MGALLTTNEKPYKMSLYLPSFQTKISVADGDWIEPKITWQGRLPNNKAEADAFLLKNSLTAEVKGSKRNFNADLDWTMDQPDLTFRTPWNGKMSCNIAGEGPEWGTYSISRDVTAAVADQVISLTVDGEASFTQGVFAEISPVHTEVDMKYLMNDTDLVGKFSKVMQGKEYSIEFPAGTFVMPEITWGQ